MPFGSLTGGAEHGPGCSGRYGCSGCCGTEVFTPVAFQRWGPRPRGCTEALRLFVVEGSRRAGLPLRRQLCTRLRVVAAPYRSVGLVKTLVMRLCVAPTAAGPSGEPGRCGRSRNQCRCRSCRDRSPWVARRGLVRFRVEPTAGALRASRPSPDDPRRSCNAGERAVAGLVRSQGTGSLWCGRPYVAPIERRNPPCGGLLGLGRTCP